MTKKPITAKDTGTRDAFGDVIFQIEEFQERKVTMRQAETMYQLALLEKEKYDLAMREARLSGIKINDAGIPKDLELLDDKIASAKRLRDAIAKAK